METYLYADLYKLEDTHWWHRAKRALALQFIQKYLPKRPLKIIDIGCGTGKNVEAFAPFGTVWGLDPSAEAIAFCKKRKLKLLKKAPAEKTGLPKNSFDLVTLFDVLEHTDDTKTVPELFRITKPGGYVMISVPAYRWLWSGWDEVLHHKKRYEKNELNGLFQKNGFTIIKSSYAFSYLIVPVLIVRTIKSLRKKSSYGSDFGIDHPLISAIMNVLSAVERWCITLFDIPFGTSIILLARKKS